MHFSPRAKLVQLLPRLGHRAFWHLSSDFSVFMGFIACERALQTIELRDVKPTLALAVHRRALVRRIGILTSRGWAQRIVDRCRDAVSNRPAALQTADIDLAADAFLSNNPSRGGYRGT